MKNNFLKCGLILLIFHFQSCVSTKTVTENNRNHIWTFTYLKAIENQKVNLENYIEKNWFVIDSIAVKQKLIAQYELYENKDPENKDWDFIVAVEYFSPKGYQDISSDFEAIRTKHQVVKINGLVMKDLGRIVKSETILRKNYFN
ncbi:MAG: hypothetical protein L6Q46_07545 [Flavobacterium sp.]|uniref:hypothetical protein n=1 Tax=Flavobacterium sp. TaxID=239 RepID=UPI0025C5DE60|nr:hypothetical protein [Flavobacterium sp.]MCK6608142.1 hypothetical protein [Flavobacterium sp.]